MSDAEPLVRGKTWEEMPVGSRFRTASRTITEADLVNFITMFGFNEPLFWDARHAATAGFKGRLVPGALTYSMAEGLVIQSHILHGTGLAFMGMQLDVKRPVYVGDTIHAVVEVTESRAASSGPDRGVVTTRISVRNQDDEEVLVFVPVRLIRGESYVDQ
ncbi:MAG TPA: MaoC/PaaZ C-terminal domain-containing protein [Acidimicrobiales bacterium]|jgi:acyl dehydratase|nr:MaoC/PaaZ C-terminal domain-containing protein [Acidimicrobiales bacterium]